MGVAASSWPFIPKKQVGEKSSTMKRARLDYLVITPSDKRGNSNKCPSWDCLADVIVFLDSASFRNIPCVSRSWSRQFDSRGSQISSDAVLKLLGQGHDRILDNFSSRSGFTPDTKDWNLYPRRIWTDACDFLIGYFHSHAPRGSQTSTSMALALVSDFIACLQTRNLAESVLEKEAQQLCSNSYLLAFTAIAISIKIEEGLYFDGDKIPFPKDQIPNVTHSVLSTENVLEAEQIILRVLKLTVPVCYFAQFARPLWHRIRTVHDQQWRQQISAPVIQDTLPFPVNSKLAVFRFVHHASARHFDCSAAGSAIHPSVKALCVSILSIALYHTINFKSRTQQRQQELQQREYQNWDVKWSQGEVIGLSRTEVDARFADATRVFPLSSSIPTVSALPRVLNKKKRLEGRRKGQLKRDVCDITDATVNSCSVLKFTSGPSGDDQSTHCAITPIGMSSRTEASYILAPPSMDVGKKLPFVLEESELDNQVEGKKITCRSNFVKGTKERATCPATAARASGPSAMEVFGSELIAALLYDDLKDREIGGMGSAVLHAPRKALNSLMMTMDALLSSLEGLNRLRKYIIVERATLGAALSTRASASSSSTLVSVASPSLQGERKMRHFEASEALQLKKLKKRKICGALDSPNRCHGSNLMDEIRGPKGGKNNQKESTGAPRDDSKENDALQIETFRILLNTNRTGSGGKEGRQLVATLCDISQRELSGMQTQLSSALHVAFSRYKPRSPSPPISGSNNTPERVPGVSGEYQRGPEHRKQQLCCVSMESNGVNKSSTRPFSTENSSWESTGARKLEM